MKPIDQLLYQRDLLVRTVRQRDGISVERLADKLDDGIASEYRNLSAQELTRASQKLKDTLRAIEKCAEKTYGVCDVCDERINPKRMAFAVEVIRCVTCQQKQDERQSSSEVHLHLGGSSYTHRK